MDVPKIKRTLHIPLLITLLVLMLLPFFIKFGFNFDKNLLLLKGIYKARLEARSEHNIFTSYFIFWISNAIAPIILIYGVIRKNFIIIIISISAFIYLYLVAGANKAIFFSVFVILYFSFIKNYYKKIFLFLLCLIVLMITGRICNIYFNSLIIEDLLVRRTFFDPALLNVFYFEFFNDNFMYLSHSILGSIIQNPYNIQPSYVIGINYFHNPEANAGNGIISDGFMNFGLFGVFISIVISSFTLSFFNSLKINSRFTGLFFLILYGFSCTGILTNFLTLGLFLVILISIFFLKDTEKSKKLIE